MKSFDEVKQFDIATLLDEEETHAKVIIMDKCRCADNGFEKMMERNKGVVLADWCANHPKDIYYDLFDSKDEEDIKLRDALEIVLTKNISTGEIVWYEYDNSEYCVIVE